MIVTGVSMTLRERAAAGSERAPVAAPLAVLVICALLVLIQLYLAIPLAEVIGKFFGARGPAAAAALGTTYSLAYGLGFLIFGPLSDRYGRKLILVPGMVVLALATAGLAAASSLPMVAVLRIGQGLVAASFPVVALAYVGEALPPRWRSTGIGAMSTAFLVAGIIGQVYSQAIAEAYGWRWVFGLAVPAFAIGAVAMAIVLLEPARSGPPVSWGGKYRELGALAVRRELALPYAANLPVLFSFVAMYAALGPLLQSQFGPRPRQRLICAFSRATGIATCSVGGLARGTLRPRPRRRRRLCARRARPCRGGHLGRCTVGPGAIEHDLRLGYRHDRARVDRPDRRSWRLLPSRSPRHLRLALFTGASFGPLVAQLPIGFSTLMLALAALLLIAAALVAASSRPRSEVAV